MTTDEFPDRMPGCDPRVPYHLLDQARANARAAHPDAGRIKALWTPNSANAEIHVEIWDAANRSARVLAATS